MMRFKSACFLLLMLPLSGRAINVGSVTTFINDEQQQIFKEIENDSEQARLVSVSLLRISSPEEGGEVISMETEGELLLSPARMIIPGNSKSNIRFTYHGPDDNKERYYRVIWRDTPLSVDEQVKGKRQVMATTTAQIGTILVVTPRQSKFKYEFKDAMLINNGNASYRVVAYGVCRDNSTEHCKETYFDLPGKERRFKFVDVENDKSHIGVWLGERFVSVK